MREKNMKLKAILLISTIFLSKSMPLFASEEMERIYLTQILNQLHAIKPLINQAAKEQPKVNRVQFHYTQYRDADGKLNHGLIEDVNEIEKGIREKLHDTPSAPHLIKLIKGDYIEHTKNKVKT